MAAYKMILKMDSDYTTYMFVGKLNSFHVDYKRTHEGKPNLWWLCNTVSLEASGCIVTTNWGRDVEIEE